MKKTKKIIGTIFCLASMAAAVMPVSASPGYTLNTSGNSEGEGIVPARQTLFFEDFENEASKSWSEAGSYKLGNDLPGDGDEQLTLSGNGSGLGIVNANLEGGTLKISKNQTQGKDFVFLVAGESNDYGSTTFNGTLVTELDFKFDGLTSGRINLFEQMRVGKVATDGTGVSFLIVKTGGKNELRYSDNGVETATGIYLNEAQWYHVKLKHEVEEARYSLWLNGLNITNGYVQANPASTAFASKSTEGLERILRTTACAASGASHEFDNIWVYKEPTGYVSHYKNDFNSYNTTITYGADENNFITATPQDGDTTVTKSIIDMGYNVTLKDACAIIDSEQKALKLGNNSKVRVDDTLSDNATKSNPFTMKGTESIAFTFWTDKPTGNFGTLFRIDPDAEGYGGYCAALEMKSGNLYVSHTADGKPALAIEGIEADKKYNVVMHYNAAVAETRDVTHESYERAQEGSFDVYVDGKCVIYNMGIYKPTGVEVGTATGIHRPINIAANGAFGGNLYMDDLVLYQDEREEALANVLSAVGYEFENELYADGIILPSVYDADNDGTNDYNITWNSSDDAVDVTNGTVTRSENDTTVCLTATASDVNNEYAVTRSLDVTVPNRYGLEISASGSAVTAVAETSGAVLVAAVYDENMNMVDVAVGTVSGGSNVAVINGLEKGKYTAKAFLFESIGSLKPICKKISTAITLS